MDERRTTRSNPGAYDRDNADLRAGVKARLLAAVNEAYQESGSVTRPALDELALHDNAKYQWDYQGT